MAEVTHKINKNRRIIELKINIDIYCFKLKCIYGGVNKLLLDIKLKLICFLLYCELSIDKVCEE